MVGYDVKKQAKEIESGQQRWLKVKVKVKVEDWQEQSTVSEGMIGLPLIASETAISLVQANRLDKHIPVRFTRPQRRRLTGGWEPQFQPEPQSP